MVATLKFGMRGTAVAQWLRCCATNRKVAGSIPGGVIGIFHWHKILTMALGSTQPLTEMSTRSISWGKGGRCVRMTTLPPSCAVLMKSGNLNFLEPSGPFQACNGTALPLYICKHTPTYTHYILWIPKCVTKTLVRGTSLKYANIHNFYSLKYY